MTKKNKLGKEKRTHKRPKANAIPFRILQHPFESPRGTSSQALGRCKSRGATNDEGVKDKRAENVERHCNPKTGILTVAR